MEKESTQTALSYEHQRQIRKSGIRKGHESWATRKIISMRNNPKAQRWEKSKTILGSQRGRSTEVGCARRVRRSSKPLGGRRELALGWGRPQRSHHSRSPLSSAAHPHRPWTPWQQQDLRTGLLGRGAGRGKTTGPGEQVSTCQGVI